MEATNLIKTYFFSLWARSSICSFHKMSSSLRFANRSFTKLLKWQSQENIKPLHSAKWYTYQGFMQPLNSIFPKLFFIKVIISYHILPNANRESLEQLLKNSIFSSITRHLPIMIISSFHLQIISWSGLKGNHGLPSKKFENIVFHWSMSF